VARSVQIDIAAGAAAEYHDQGWWREQTLLDDFLRHVADQPGKTAIVSDHAGRPPEVVSYGELGVLVDRIAGGLIELGVQPGEVVSYQLPNWWQFAALHLACARVGAVTNAILPILRQREVTFILQRTQSRICVTPGTFRGFDYAGMLLDVQAEVPTLERIFTVADDTRRDGTASFDRFFLNRDAHPAADLDRLRPGADTAGQIQFTSGTTGEPKGVVHTYNTMWAGVRSVSEFIGLTGDDVLLACSPMAHTVGFYFGCSLPMMAGMTVVCQDVWDPVRMLELVAGHGIAWTMAAPTFLADVCAAAAATGIATPSMRYISCAGAPIPPSLVTAVRERLGATVLAAWGMTECGAVTTNRPGDGEEHIAHTDGAPPPWAQLRVVDQAGDDLPDGTVGRLLIRGASQAITYYQRPELYAASCYDGWFDTGDLARHYPDGYIRLCGRTKDLVIRGGENIPVVEVEAALSTVPAVREVTIIAVPDERLGERACAVVVPADPAAPPTLAGLLAHLAALDMSRHFWPEHLKIVDALPKTATGKIQKFRLRTESAGWDLPPAGGSGHLAAMKEDR
jgi:cyclohexanecarboxylate-CoA ligase